MTEHTALESQSSFSPHGELRTAFYNPHEIKRRRRTSRSQFKTLEKAFCENPKPNASTRRHLAQSLSMTPRGIQVWFQNRRAKSKQTSNVPTDQISADDTMNHAEAPRMDESSLSHTQDGAPFSDNGQESKEDITFQQQESTNTAATFSSSPDVRAPIHSSGRRQTTSVPDAMSSVSDGGHTNARHSMHLTWDPSQNWQNTPNVAPFNQSSSSIKSSTRHPKEPVPQSTPGAQDKSIERFKTLQYDGSPDFSQSTSAKAPCNGHEELLQSQESTAARYNTAVNTKNHSTPSTLSLMRRMSMPATIGSEKAAGSNAWIGPQALPLTQDLHQPGSHTHTHQSHSQTPFSIPQHPSLTAMAARPIHPLAEHDGKSSLLDNRARNRAYPLLRRVSIHETGSPSTLTTYKAKFTHSCDVPGAQPSGIGSLAAAAAARRRRRSSVSKPAHLSTTPEFSTVAVSSSGATMAFRASSGADECSKQEQALKTDIFLDTPTSLTLQNRNRTTLASNTGYQDTNTWIQDYLNQQQPACNSVIPPTLGLLAFSTGSSLSEVDVTSTMTDQEETAPHQLHSTQTIDSTTLSSGVLEASRGIKSGRRRSSLKTGKTRPQSGTRVQFDVQPLTPLTQESMEGHDRDEMSSMELGRLQTFIDGLPKQGAAWDQWGSATHQDAPKSNVAPESRMNSTPFNTPPVATSESPLACIDSPPSFVPYEAMAESNRCLPNQTQSQSSQDSQQLRRNSCPPEFIECFSRGLQIIPEALILEEHQQAFMHGFQSDLEQQQSQYQYSFQMQALQTQQQQQPQQQHPQQPPHHHHPQQLMEWMDTQDQFHLSSEGSTSFHIPHNLASSQESLGLGATSLDDTNVLRAQSPANQGRGRGDMDSRSIRRMNLSDLGPRQQAMDSHNLPQLQTPRLLAQLQHQIAHPSWSRTMSLSIEPLAARPRPALSDTLQSGMVRRYSEPGKGFDMASDAPAAPGHSGADLAEAAPSSTMMSTAEQQESAQRQPWCGDVALSQQLPLLGQSPEHPFSKALHPLEVAMTSVGLNTAPNTMSMSTPLTPLNGVTPSTGPQMSFLPSSISIASASSSLSPCESPSSSPLTDKHYNQQFCSGLTASPASSANASSTFNISSPMRGSSAPTRGSPSTAVALGNGLEAPLLMRAHSLDSLMLQAGPRDPQEVVISSGASSPLRRHSQGPALVNSEPNTTEQPYQPNTPTPHRELAQQSDHHSYFNLSFQPYPSPSSYGAQAPLDIHPLEQQYHYQQQQTYSQLPTAMIQQPSTLPSPPYASPTFFSLQYDASGTPMRPTTAAARTQETVQNLDNKERMASARTLSHFESMQQSLPHTKHQRRQPPQGARRPEQGLQSSQEQQQQQPSPAAEWPMSFSPLLTAPAFRDPRAFEEYKHQQFILEHKRLQQQQEQQQQQQEPQPVQQPHSQSVREVALGAQDHSLSAAAGVPAGSIAIATAQNATATVQNAPYPTSA